MFGFESILRKPKKEAVDEGWFSKFEAVGKFETYEYLNGDKTFRDAQKAAFLKGEVVNPSFDYPLIKAEEWQGKLEALHKLKKEIKKTEKNEAVKKAYLWRINEKKAEIRMLLATKQGEEAKNEPDSKKREAKEKNAVKNFKNMTEFVYGQPDKDVFAYTLREIHELCDKSKQSSDGNIAQAAMELAAYLPKPMVTEKEYTMPSAETVKVARQVTENEFSGLLEGLPIDSSKISLGPNEMEVVCQAAMDKVNAMVHEDERWTVIQHPKSTALSASQEQRELRIPPANEKDKEKEKSWAVGAVSGLVSHELGTHVVRRMAGARSKLRLLSLGLDRYDAGEEGVAKMREEVIAGEVDEFAGMETHFAAGLVVGTDGQPRNFRETYEIMHKLYRLRNLIKREKMVAAGEKVKSTESVLAKAADDAYVRCVRTIRGTDGQQRGVAFTKDMIYREGNIRVWDVIGKNPGAMMRFSIGKFDPGNDRHIWLLDQLGITEEEDEAADKAMLGE